MTRCQDRNCPMAAHCLRYDARPMEDPKTSYFGRSPRSRERCEWYEPSDHTVKFQVAKPLSSSEWPKDEHARIIDERG